MSARCVLVHPTHPISHAIFAKAALEGVQFLAAPDACDELQRCHAGVLAAVPNALMPLRVDDHDVENPHGQSLVHLLIDTPAEDQRHQAELRVRIVESTAEGDPSGDGITLALHDVLPPLAASRHERMFKSWMEASRAGSQPPMEDEHFHWCDLNDVTAAIAVMLRHPARNATYHVSGRRRWTADETWQEFHTLVQRTLAGRTGMFSTEHLTTKGIPAVQAVALVDGEPKHSRPDLEPLHAYLTETNGEGWRPKTSLRQSLMMVIARLSEPQLS